MYELSPFLKRKPNEDEIAWITRLADIAKKQKLNYEQSLVLFASARLQDDGMPVTDENVILYINFHILPTINKLVGMGLL
jgi:hypothetical protein